MGHAAVRTALADGDVDHLIEIRGVFDGWSILVRKSDGAHLNRWASEDDPTRPEPGYGRRYYETQDVIYAQTIEED